MNSSNQLAAKFTRRVSQDIRESATQTPRNSNRLSARTFEVPQLLSITLSLGRQLRSLGSTVSKNVSNGVGQYYARSKFGGDQVFTEVIRVRKKRQRVDYQHVACSIPTLASNSICECSNGLEPVMHLLEKKSVLCKYLPAVGLGWRSNEQAIPVT